MQTSLTKKPNQMKVLYTFLISCFCVGMLFSQTDISSVEYFFDTDPGFGNGTSIDINPDAALIDQTFNISTTGLIVGTHRLFLRAVNVDGTSSMYEHKTFRVNPVSDTNISTLVEAEYFFDIDPGFGSGTLIDIVDIDNLDDVLTVSTSGLSVGTHRLFVRVKNTAGVWSLYDHKTFRVAPASDANTSTLVEAEYFVDIDPGFGNGILIDIVDIDNLDDVLSVSTSGLSIGTHRLFIRVKNAAGIWSLYEHKTFRVAPVNDINTSIDKLKITDNSPIVDFEAYLMKNDDNSTTLNLKAIRALQVSSEATPFVSTSASLAVLQGLGVFNSVVQSRQNSTRGLGSGDEAFKDRYMWVKPFGMYTKQDDKDGIYGFDAHTYGVGLGMDGEYKPGFRAGLAFFYSGVSVDTNHIDQSDDMDVYNIVAYGSNPIIDDRSILFYQMGFGIQKNSSKRHITATNQTATADYTSKTFYIQAKATRDYFVNDKLTVTPSIKGAIRYFRSPSYSESGAGAYNLNVSKFSTTQSILGISTDLRYKINDKTRFTTNLALDYDFKNDAQSVDFSFQGADAWVYNTKGIKNSALGYRFGIGISNIMKKNLMFDLGYSLNGRGSDFINHAITAKFKWKF